MTTNELQRLNKSYRFSIAPMMDCTDRHYRVLMRHISRRAMLYTEMIVVQALTHSQRKDLFLDFDDIEHPIALQVGGDNPQLLKEAILLAEEWGYDEINLNIGCPSPRVQSGNFGACLMAKPELVAGCIEAMKKVSNLPITVKHRTGIDNLDTEEFLINFVDKLHQAGAERFAIHARKAWLSGLNPKENRTMPQLQYEKVFRLKELRPEITIELNGGIKTPNDCLNILESVDGAMVGRAAYEDPMKWQAIDEMIFKDKHKNISCSELLRKMIPYGEAHLIRGGKIWDIAKHLLKIVKNVPGANSWRREFSLKTQKHDSNIAVFDEAAQQLEDAGL